MRYNKKNVEKEMKNKDDNNQQFNVERTGILVFGKMLNQLWQFLMRLGIFLLLQMAKYFKKLAFWSHLMKN